MGQGTDPSDQELVDAYIAGDHKAFSAIVERHRARLISVARRYTSNDYDAQDVVQEALLRASRKMRSYRSEAKLSTWLHRLVMNSGYDYLNHRANRKNASLDAVIEADRNALLGHDPSRYIDDRLLLEQAMQLLRPDQREAVYLTDIAGFPVADVADKQGVRPGTIKSRRARAKDVMREALSA